MAYPTEIELAEFCIDSKLVTGFPVDYTPYITAIRSSITTFHKQTGWASFLVTDETEETFRKFIGNMCDFEGGFAEITEIVYDDDTAAVEWTDYELYPERSYPKRFLKFLTRPATKLTVTGKLGYCTVLPDDVKQALLAHGAALVATALNGTGQLVKIKQGDVEYQYAEGSSVNPTTQYAQWMAQFDSVVSRYKRSRIANG